MLQIEKDCTEGKNHWIPLKLDQKKAWETSKQKRMFMLSHEWPKRNIFRVLIQFNVSLVKNNALLFKNMVCFGIWTGSSGLLACTVVKDLHTHRPCSVPSASRSLKVLFAATPSSGSRRFRTSIQEEERYDQFWAAFFCLLPHLVVT